MGFRVNLLDLLETYLSELKMGEYHNDSENNNCGVPQETVLGPLLFL